MSVDLEQAMIEDDLAPTDRYPSLARAVALVAHPVSRFTDLQMTVEHAPLAENAYHGEVRAAALSRREQQAAARALADGCETIIDVDPDAVAQLAAAAGEAAPSPRG